jgi:hypothetical protein
MKALLFFCFLATVYLPSCGPSAYFMVKYAPEVNDRKAPERRVFKLNQSAVFLVGGKGYAGKTARLEYWARNRLAGKTDPTTVPQKGATAWPFISAEPLLVTAKLFIDEGNVDEITVRFEP